MNREQRRRLQKKKHAIEKEIAEKISLFGALPDACSACQAPYDKRNKEMAMSWSVVVRHAEEIVRLFCPGCINKVRILGESKENEE